MGKSRFVRFALAVALACTFAAVTAVIASARPAKATSTSSTTSSGPVLWGAYFGGTQYGLADAPWSMTTASTFETEVGKKASLVHFSLPWYKCYATCESVPFPAPQMSAIRSAGMIPVLGWNSYSQPVSTTEPNFQLADVTDGTYDAYIRNWATAAKNWGHPFFLKLDREMNLNCCYPYVESKNGNTSGQFVAMWRHVRDIFTSVGATNVTWVWDPNVAYDGSIPFSRVYPGAAYVDWTALDGYNWGTNPARPIGWRSFTEIFGPSYTTITTTVAPGLPMMVAETASTESGGYKATWITNMLGTALPTTFPKIRALLYYNYPASNLDWPIESSASATAAFGKAIQSPYYATNQFTQLSQSPIQPPSP